MTTPGETTGENKIPEEKIRVLAAASLGKTRKDIPSVLFFTTHKCASTFTSKVIKSIGSHSDYEIYDYAAAIYQLGDGIDAGDPFDFMTKNSDILFNRRGEIYGPLRMPVTIPNMDGFRKVFFLRDPRDVLVSAYYSFGFSHGLPGNTDRRRIFLKAREQIQNEGIDNYCLRALREWILPTYKSYMEIRGREKNSIYLSYDLFKDDTKGFLTSLIEFLEIREFPDRIVNQLSKSATPVQNRKPNKKLRHKRSGQSHQFESELKDSTLEELNRELTEVLRYWEFEP